MQINVYQKRRKINWSELATFEEHWYALEYKAPLINQFIVIWQLEGWI